MSRMLTTDAVARARAAGVLERRRVRHLRAARATTAPGGDVVGEIRVDAARHAGALPRDRHRAARPAHAVAHRGARPRTTSSSASRRGAAAVVTQDGRTARAAAGRLRALRLHPALRAARSTATSSSTCSCCPGPTLRAQLRGAPELTAAAVHGVARRRPPDDRDDPHARRRHRRAGAGRGRGRRAGRRAHPGGRAARSLRAAGAVGGGPARRRSRRWPGARLRDPGLTVAAIAAELHVSVSTLHRAFAGEPCIDRGVDLGAAPRRRARRPRATRRCAHRTIGDIAFSWGFCDASHFSRAFRARFGATARAVRAGAPRTGAATGRRR